MNYIESINCIFPRKEKIQSSRFIKSIFLIYFDGCYGCDPQPEVPSTMEMGVCKLDFNEYTNTLKVFLKRPGLLIGRAGKTIDGLKKYLKCNIEIVEVNLLKD